MQELMYSQSNAIVNAIANKLAKAIVNTKTNPIVNVITNTLDKVSLMFSSIKMNFEIVRQYMYYNDIHTNKIRSYNTRNLATMITVNKKTNTSISREYHLNLHVFELETMAGYY